MGRWRNERLNLCTFGRQGYHELNESAATVFLLCDGGRSFGEIVQTVREACPTQPLGSLTGDIRRCLTDFEARSLVELSGCSGQAVPVIRVGFAGFWPGFDAQDNYFLRLLAKHACVLPAAEGCADVLFQSVFGPLSERDSGDCIRVFVSDGTGTPDFDTFDYAFSPHEVEVEFSGRHSRVRCSDYMRRTKSYVIDSQAARRFRDFLFPVDLEQALQSCTQRLAAAPRDAALASLQAALVRRLSGWCASLPYWEAYWERSRKGELLPVKQGHRHDLPGVPALVEFERVRMRARQDPPESSPRVCVYTSLFGAYDELSPICAPEAGIDYICFTDQDIAVPGWRIVKCERSFSSPVLCAKQRKILPHRFLRDYEASVYVDASTFIYHDMAPLIRRFLRDEAFVMYLHPDRNDAFEDAEAILSGLRHAPEPVIRQVATYESDGLPAGAGLFEASFIWRRHGNHEVRDLMERWWREINRHSTRDQLSLAYLVWKTGIRPRTLPPELGTSRINPYFFKRPHAAAGKRVIRLPAAVTLVFLCHPRYRNLASTRMRGAQLASLINGAGLDDVRARCQEDLTVRDACVVLTKGMLREIHPGDVRTLQKENRLVAADYVDDRPREELHPYIDVYIASSIKGYFQLCHGFRDKWVFMVTHHVDRGLQHEGGGVSEFKAAYFGELENALHHQSLGDAVDFHHVSTRDASRDWLENIGRYSFHYAVRRDRKFDGAKPFLKGFIAAQCGANLLVRRDDGDASFYLPPDYPYFVEGDSEAEVRRALKEAEDSFGGPLWQYGLAAMRNVRQRSTDEWVYREVEALVHRFQK